MKLEKLSSKYYELIFDYYNANKDHLEPWEPTRAKNYYTLDFHIQRTNKRMELIKQKKSMFFVLLNDSKDKVTGVCNYTDIENEECWLGYSISKDYQGGGYMYGALVNTNNYMLREFPIKKINAGIIIQNYRSIKLINRLSFEATGNYKKLKINGKNEKLEIYSLNK